MDEGAHGSEIDSDLSRMRVAALYMIEGELRRAIKKWDGRDLVEAQIEFYLQGPKDELADKLAQKGAPKQAAWSERGRGKGRG